MKRFWALGSLLFTLFLAIRLISENFVYGRAVSLWVMLAFVACLMAGGIGLIIARHILQKQEKEEKPRISALWGLFLLGLIFRLMFFGSLPIFEDDWHRYLWDGAVVSHGLDPYAYAPAEAAVTDWRGNPLAQSDEPQRKRLQELAAAHPHIYERINYPYVGTVYPPLTQLAFAAAHSLQPFSLDAWRAVLLLSDIAALALLLACLRCMQKPSILALLYWWNPLVIVLGFNAGHMDVLIVPFVLATLLFTLHARPYLAALGLALATAVKLWPIWLAPLLFRKWRGEPGKLALIAVTLLTLSAFVLSPMLASLKTMDGGLYIYASSWERNAFLFPLLKAAISLVTSDADRLARLFIAIGLAALPIAAGLLARRDDTASPCLMLILLLAFFYLLPTGYPWYAIWFAPLIAFVPSVGAIALTAMLPLYYTRYHLADYGLEALYHSVVIPMQFGVPLVIMGLEFWRWLKRAHP